MVKYSVPSNNRIQCYIIRLHYTCRKKSVPYQPINELLNESPKGIVWLYWEYKKPSKNLLSNIFKPELTPDYNYIDLVINGNKIGRIHRNTHALLALKPGKKQIELQTPSSKNDTNTAMTIQSIEGRPILLKIVKTTFDSSKSNFNYAKNKNGKSIYSDDTDRSTYNTYDWVKIDSSSDFLKNTNRSLLYIEP